ncbi:hypothetical protein EON63_15525 [archaeon]|nr:MAG: hypothetical protein EON63_15525 [archaeon]
MNHTPCTIPGANSAPCKRFYLPGSGREGAPKDQGEVSQPYTIHNKLYSHQHIPYPYRTSKAQKKLLDSRAIAAKLSDMRRKTSATPYVIACMCM